MVLFDMLSGSRESRRFTNYTRMLMAAGLISALLLVPGCSDEKKEKVKEAVQNVKALKNAEENVANAEKPVPSVDVVKIGTEKVNFQREWPATTSSPRDVDVRARVEGNIEQFDFKEGSTVKAGQVLFTLDDSPYIADLHAARAGLAKAEADLVYAKSQVDVRTAEAKVASAKTELNQTQLDVDRYKPLAASGTIPVQTFDNAVAARDVAKANLDAAKANLANTILSDKANIDIAAAAVEAARAKVVQAELNVGYCTIICPVDGIVGKLSVAPGNLVGQAGNNEPLVTISSINPIDVVFNLAESEFLTMNRQGGDPNQFVTFDLFMGNGERYPYPGKFRMIDRSLDTTTGTMGVRISFNNPNNMLREGQYGKMRVTAKTAEDKVVVPQRAVVTIQNGQSVYLVDKNNNVVLRNIKIGDLHGDCFLVDSGLKQGEVVIVDGIQRIKVGEPCQPKFVDLKTETKKK